VNAATEYVIDVTCAHGGRVKDKRKALLEAKPTLKFLPPVEDKAQVAGTMEVLIPDAVIID
jgi:hypothetical protein